jgi:hypothetical protein
VLFGGISIDLFLGFLIGLSIRVGQSYWISNPEVKIDDLLFQKIISKILASQSVDFDPP